MRVRWATRAALETVACDEITYKLADVARGRLICAVDDALRDAEGLEEVLEYAVIPVAR